MLHKFKKIDWSIVFILAIFLVISMLLVYSATIDDHTVKVDIAKWAVIYGVSLVVMLAVSWLDYRILLKGSYYYYGAGLLLLVIVLKLGQTINGAQGWFKLPMGLNFQPVELFKLILIMTLAVFMARRKGESLTLFRDVLPIGLIVFVPFVLVIIQPDLGNAIIFLVILLGMYWIGNIRFSYVLIGAIVLGGGGYLFLYIFQHYHDPLIGFLKSVNVPEHWIGRLNTFINPDEASRDAKWQVMNSIRAIGSGSLMGEKYLHGTSIHSNFIPVAYTDAIFVVVGEEFGFVGASVLLLLYFVMIYRMILIAIYCNNHAGSYMIVGIVSMLVFQIFQNIGMMIGIMPLTGITLPFVSYGGTSLLINMLAMGLVLSIRVHDDKLLEEE